MSDCGGDDDAHDLDAAWAGNRSRNAAYIGNGSQSLVLVRDKVSQAEFTTVSSVNRKESKGAAFYSMPADVYGDTMASIFLAVDVYHKPEASRPYTGLWIFTSFLLFFMNAVFQLGLSWIMLEYVIGKKERRYHEHPVDESVELLRHTIMPLPSDSEAINLCRMNDVEYLPAYLIVVLLWYSRMVLEVGESFWQLYVVVFAPIVNYTSKGSKSVRHMLTGLNGQDDSSDNSDTDPEDEDEDTVTEIIQCQDTPGGELLTIMRMPRWVKPCIVIFVTLPKLIIALIITWLGAKFLEYTENVGELVLKVMTCVFFVTIDEILYKSFVSTQKQAKLSNMAIRYKNLSAKSAWWVNWGSSWLRIFLVVTATLFTHFVAFGFLHHFRSACIEYRERFPEAYAKAM